MPLIRSLASERAAYCFKLVAVIFLLSKIIPTYFHCVLKGLVYIAIIAPLGCQPSCTKYIKLNMRLSCNIKLVFNTKYTFLLHSYTLRSLRLPYLIYVGNNVICGYYMML